MAKIVQASEKKWGSNLSKAGFTILPNHLIAFNQFVGDEYKLTPTEFFVLVQILLHWWAPADMPFPSKSTISARTGLSPRQVQRTLSQLEEKRLVRRVARYGESNFGRMSNAYDLGPLVSKLREIAEIHPTIQSRMPEKIKAPTEVGASIVQDD